MTAPDRAARARISLSSPWVWAPAALLVAALVPLHVADENRRLFVVLNGLGPVTSDVLWANLTVLGGTLAAVVLLLPLWRSRPDLIWAVTLGVALSTLWAQGLKPFVNLDRPPRVLQDVYVIGRAHKHHSFPSGHAATAFMVAAVLGLGYGARIWAVLALACASAIAISRVVVGVHWPLDVVAGALGGWASGVFALALAARFPVGTTPPWRQILAFALGGCAVMLTATSWFGRKPDFPDAVWIQRVIGAGSLALGILVWVRGPRPSSAPLANDPR